MRSRQIPSPLLTRASTPVSIPWCHGQGWVTHCVAGYNSAFFKEIQGLRQSWRSSPSFATTLSKNLNCADEAHVSQPCVTPRKGRAGRESTICTGAMDAIGRTFDLTLSGIRATFRAPPFDDRRNYHPSMQRKSAVAGFEKCEPAVKVAFDETIPTRSQCSRCARLK